MTRPRQKGRPETSDVALVGWTRSLLPVVRTSLHDPTYVLPLLVLRRELLERTQVLVFLSYVRTAAVIQHTPRIALRAAHQQMARQQNGRMGSLVWGYVVHRTHTQLAWAPPPPRRPRVRGASVSNFKFASRVLENLHTRVNILTHVHFPDTRTVLELDLTFVAIVTSKLSVLGTRLMSSRRKRNGFSVSYMEFVLQKSWS